MIAQFVPLIRVAAECSRDSLPPRLIESERNSEARQHVMPSAARWNLTDVAYGNWRRKVDLLLQAHLLLQGNCLEVAAEQASAHLRPHPALVTPSLSPLDLEQIVSKALEGQESAVSELPGQLVHWRMITATARPYRELAYTGMSLIVADPSLITEMRATENDDSYQTLPDWLATELLRLYLFAFVMVLEVKECLKTAGDEKPKQVFRQYLCHWQSRQQQSLHGRRLVDARFREVFRKRTNCRHVLDARYARVT